jgi:hypothetical protein
MHLAIYESKNLLYHDEPNLNELLAKTQLGPFTKEHLQVARENWQ